MTNVPRTTLNDRLSLVLSPYSRHRSAKYPDRFLGSRIKCRVSIIALPSSATQTKFEVVACTAPGVGTGGKGQSRSDWP